MKVWLATVFARTKWNSIVAFIVIAVIGYQVVSVYLEKRDKPDLDAFAEFNTVVRGPMRGVEISSWPGCAKPFEIHLTEEELSQFVAAAAFADQQGISGHSGPILEAKLTIITLHSALEYYATVNRYEPEDLFLRRRVRTAQPDGSMKDWQYREVRIPNLGKWMFSIAPNAAL